MSKYFLTLLLFFYSLFSLTAQELTIRFDMSNAVSMLKLLGQKDINDKEFEHFLSLKGTKALIEKVKSSPDTLRSAILKVIREQPLSIEEKKFQLRYVSRNIDSLRSFVSELSEQQELIETSVRKALLPYVPKGRNMSVTIYGTIGGFSMGYTLGDDSTFFLGIHFFKNDLCAIIENCKHELFHNIQVACYNSNWVNEQLEKKCKRAAIVHAFLGYLFKEGTAEYVADLSKFERTPKIKELVEHAEVNIYRSTEVFYLFERLMIDAYNHPESVDLNRTYNILFDWNWNNPAYYLGYQMMKSMVAWKDAKQLMTYLGSDPAVFMLDYIKLSKSNRELAPYVYSKEFEVIVRKVNKWVKELKNEKK